MTTRQLIRNLMSVDNFDAEIPFILIVRDEHGSVISKTEVGEYTCYLTPTNKLVAEKRT